MTSQERENVLAYARAYADYIASTVYGQQGKAPACCLPDPQGDDIRRAVGSGRRAGEARRRKDEATASEEHRYHANSRYLGLLHRLTADVLAECFSIGYKA